MCPMCPMYHDHPDHMMKKKKRKIKFKCLFKLQPNIDVHGLHGHINLVMQCMITIDTILQKFAYPCAKRYADFIGFSGAPHLKFNFSRGKLT